MKYTCSIKINLPLDKVVKLWEDESYFKEWQDGFKSIELLKGEKNLAGSESKIIFDGKRRIELIETIIVNNLPYEKTALYEHVHMTNTQTTRFQALSENETEYISEVEYIKFNIFLLKIVAKLLPSLFKKQSEKWMKQFKVFVEKS